MPNYFNKNLPFIRKKQNMTQGDLAKKIGVDQSTISLWENGMDVTVENAIKVAEALNVPTPEFMGTDMTLNKSSLDETDLLFDKYKDVLTDSDKNIIKAIIEERKREIDKELGEND